MASAFSGFSAPVLPGIAKGWICEPAPPPVPAVSIITTGCAGGMRSLPARFSEIMKKDTGGGDSRGNAENTSGLTPVKDGNEAMLDIRDLYYALISFRALSVITAAWARVQSAPGRVPSVIPLDMASSNSDASVGPAGWRLSTS